MNNKYKLVVGIRKRDSAFSETEVLSPLYFVSLDELRHAYLQIKTRIEEEGKRVWFARVWEFGKEDYHDMEGVLE